MDSQLDNDLRAIVAAFFAANVHGLVAEPKRLDGLARLAGIPAERVPAIRSALHEANRVGGTA